MTSRDAQASYYDLELPDGTRTEVWSVLRAVLTPEEAVGYAKGCLLTRIMRDGKKLDVDRLREAEKIGTEAGMLREAMEAYLATPRAIAVTISCDDPAARIAELERELEQSEARANARLRNMESARDRIAELERERDSARMDFVQAHRERDELRKTLEAERAANVATAEELERVRKDLADLRKTYDVEMDFRAEMRRELGAHAVEGFDAFLRRVCRELTTLRERYRERKQVEEPAPLASVLAWNPVVEEWIPSHGSTIQGHVTWTHQPPTPEGE